MAKTFEFTLAVVGLACFCVMAVWGGPAKHRSDILGISVRGGESVANGGMVDFGGIWAGGKERVINFTLKYRGKDDFDGARIEIRNSTAFSKRPYRNTSKFIQRYFEGTYRFAVAFAPRKRGQRLGKLIIRRIGPGWDPIAYTVDLTGTAWKVKYQVLSGDGSRAIPCGITQPKVETGTDYGRVRVGSSTSRMFLIINSLKDPWLNPVITLAGDNAGDFILPGKGLARRIAGKKEKPLDGDYRLSQYVYFAPKAPGIRRARILIRSTSGRDQAKPCEIHIQGEAFE